MADRATLSTSGFSEKSTLRLNFILLFATMISSSLRSASALQDWMLKDTLMPRSISVTTLHDSDLLNLSVS